MPMATTKRRRERRLFRYPDTGAVAFCAGRASMEPRVADTSLVATDRYYATVYNLEFVWPYFIDYRKGDMDALRRKHPDLFAPTGIARPPSARELAIFLEREVGLSQLEARRFIRAQVAWCELMAAAQG
jgi:hypothetical protein